MKNILILLIVLAVASTFYLLSSKQYSMPQFSNTKSTEESKSETIDQFLKTKPDTSVLEAGGNSYLDPKGVYVVLYPNNYTMDTQNDNQYTRFFMRGETQRGQTEIYDGVLVVIESVDLKQQSLENWIDSKISESTTDGSTEIIKPKQKTKINDYLGYTYETKGFGSAVFVTLQKTPQSNYAVSITISVNDPQQKGYQTEVDAILATLEILK